MLAYTTAEMQAIEGSESTVAFRTLISLPGSIYPDITLAIETGNVQTSMVTNAPANVGRPTGYTSRQFTFTASGQVDPTDETKTAFWLFNKANAASPLYRQTLRGIPIELDYGVMVPGSATPAYFRKFTGVTDDVTINGDGTCNFICLDYRNKLRGTVNLPAVVTSAPYNAGLTSEYVIDALLRAATNGSISSWPAQRAQCVLAAGLRTSLWPEVGQLVNQGGIGDFVFGPGSFGSGLVNSIPVPPFASEGPLYTLASPVTSDDIYIEQLVSFDNPQGFALALLTSSARPILITVASNTVTVLAGSGLYSPAPFTISAGSKHVLGVHINWPAAATSFTATVTVDTTIVTSGSITTSARPAAAIVQCSVTPGGMPIAGLQVTTESAPVPNGSFVPGAVLDPSLNPLSVTPAISGDPWAAIQAAAGAERGFAGFDVFGVFQFKNRHTLAGGLSGRTVDARTSLKDRSLQEAGGGGSVNHVTVPVNQWTFSAGQTVWTPGTALGIRGGGTLVQNIVLDTSVGLAGNIALTDSGVLANGATPGGSTWWRAATDSSGLNAVTSGVSVKITNPTSAGFTVTVTNSNPFPVWLVSSAAYSDMAAGTPALFVGGILATIANTATADAQWPPLSEGGAVSTQQGDTTYAYDSSDWFQDLPTQQWLANDTLVDLADGITLLTNVDMVPDPRLDMGDVVTLVDTIVFGLNDPVTIFALTDTFGSGQWDQTASMSLVANFGRMIWDLTGRCEWDLNTYV